MRVGVNPIPRHPVFTPREAVAYARGQVDSPDKDYTGMCLHSVAWCYGFTSSGVYDASSFWRGMPSALKTLGGGDPPTGAIALWTGGSAGHGHAAVVVGANRAGTPMVASTDIRRAGRIDVVPLREVSSRWGLPYEGWSVPYFQFGTVDSRPAPGVYGSKWEHGIVRVAELRADAPQNDSVRRLQSRLGLRATGNYNRATADSVAALRDLRGLPGSPDRVGNRLANEAFGSDFFVKPE